MATRDTVVLLGSSLLMDTVEASLQRNRSLDVIRIRADDVNWRSCMNLLSPDLVIFDWGLPCSQALVILRDQPGVPLIGLDAATSSVIALSSREYTPVTSKDLAELIHVESWESTVTRKAGRSGLLLSNWGDSVVQ